MRQPVPNRWIFAKQSHLITKLVGGTDKLTCYTLPSANFGTARLSGTFVLEEDLQLGGVFEEFDSAVRVVGEGEGATIYTAGHKIIIGTLGVVMENLTISTGTPDKQEGEEEEEEEKGEEEGEEEQEEQDEEDEEDEESEEEGEEEKEEGTPRPAIFVKRDGGLIAERLDITNLDGPTILLEEQQGNGGFADSMLPSARVSFVDCTLRSPAYPSEVLLPGEQPGLVRRRRFGAPCVIETKAWQALMPCALDTFCNLSLEPVALEENEKLLEPWRRWRSAGARFFETVDEVVRQAEEAARLKYGLPYTLYGDE